MNPALTTFCCLAIAVTAIYASSLSSPPEADSSNEKHVIQPKAPDHDEKIGNDEFRLWYIGKGTRSEGVHGALCVDGKWIEGMTIGETVTSNLGVYTWFGPWDARILIWDKSGWLPKHLSRVYPSWALQNDTEQGAAANP